MPTVLLLIAFMALFAIGNVASALAPTYHWMLVFRFLSGLPHGAYFGVAALVAASIVPLHFRTRAVSTILMGLTVGTVLGVPVVNIISHAHGWRWTFAIVGEPGGPDRRARRRPRPRCGRRLCRRRSGSDSRR